jgi:uncharacterized HAD superfamily protein
LWEWRWWQENKETNRTVTSWQIYVDLDDVLSETARAFTGLLEQEFKKRVDFEDIFSFDLAQSFGLNVEELQRFMHLVHLPEFLSALEPVDGAVEGLKQLASLGYEIAVVTGRPPLTAEVSRAWLERHGVPYDRLTFVDKYGRGGFGASHNSVITLDELIQSGFFFAVEDSSDMAALLTTEMEVPVALLERPWNREVQFSDPRSVALIERCADWAAIVERFST